MLIYALSYLVRNKLLHLKYTSGFTEIGIFLFVFGIDKEIHKYLPDRLLMQSGFAFVFVFLISILSGSSKKVVLPVLFLILIMLFLSGGLLENYFNNLFLENERIADFIIGLPIIYLAMTVFGLNSIIASKQN